MNLLDALVIVRNASLVSNTMHTRQGQTARKVIDRKIQGLLRKKAWRDAAPGTIPIHMVDRSLILPMADDPLVKALRRLVAAEAAARDQFGTAERLEINAAIEEARGCLAWLETAS